MSSGRLRYTDEFKREAAAQVTGGLILRDDVSAGKVFEFDHIGSPRAKARRLKFDRLRARFYFDRLRGRAMSWAKNGTPGTNRLKDHLGSLTATVLSSGAVHARKYTTPFGEQIYNTPADEQGPGGDWGHQLFTGHTRDKSTNLNYMQARFHDPVIGRFLSTDPIGYQDQFNLYAYVYNDPTNVTDPTGECPWCIAGAIIGGGLQLASEINNRNIDLSDGIQASDLRAGARVAGATALGAVGGGAAGAAIKAVGRAATNQVAKVGTGQAAKAGGRAAANSTSRSLSSGGRNGLSSSGGTGSASSASTGSKISKAAGTLGRLGAVGGATTGTLKANANCNTASCAGTTILANTLGGAAIGVAAGVVIAVPPLAGAVVGGVTAYGVGEFVAQNEEMAVGNNN